jgi:hypothetical protein
MVKSEWTMDASRTKKDPFPDLFLKIYMISDMINYNILQIKYVEWYFSLM